MVKICGITNLKDARKAFEAGADFIGFNFYPHSPRYVSPRTARRILQHLPKKVAAVGVFVNEREDKMLEIAREVGLDYLQLHGEESPEMVARLARNLPVIKAVRVRDSFRAAELARFKRASAFLLDGFDRRRHGGSGKTFRWNIRSAKPYAVDVCSGVEKKPGKKDPALVANFMQAVRAAQRKVR
jgi:phosphoribosylanthranilate isomerase